MKVIYDPILGRLRSSDASSSSGGGTVWGTITGTLSNQTDLQNALNLKATLASPTFTGTPAAPTATLGTNTTQLATTAFVIANAGVSLFTQASGFAYLTSTTDKLQVGSVSNLGYKFGVTGGGVGVINSTIGFIHEKASGSYFLGSGFNGNNPFLTYYGETNFIIGYGTNTGTAPNVNNITLKNNGDVDVFGVLTGMSGLKAQYDGSNYGTISAQSDGHIVYDATGTAPYHLFNDPVKILANSGSFSGVGTATTVFTVTIGTTQANATYKVGVTPTAVLSAAVFYVTNKTTTTFDVTYLAGLTGTVTFDWVVTP